MPSVTSAAALLLLVSFHGAAATVYHTQAIDTLVAATNTSSIALNSEVDIVNLTTSDPTTTAFVNLFAPIGTGTWLTTSVALMAVCVGHSLASIDVITSVPKLGAALSGAPTSDVFVAIDGARYAAHNVVFVLPRATTTMTVILSALARQNIVGYTAKDEYPQAVRDNPRIVWVATDADVPAAVRQAPNRVGFAAMSQCNALRKAGITVTVNARSTLTRPDMVANSAGLYTDDQLEVVPSSSQATYPFVGNVLLNLKSPVACNVPGEGPPPDYKPLLDLLESTIVRPVLFTHSQTVPLRDKQIMASLSRIGDVCASGRHTTARGSSAIAPVVHRWASEYIAAAGTIIDYTGSGSGSGIRAIKQYEVPFAGSDSLFDDQERRDYPTIRFAPAVTFAVSVVVNIPGSSVVTIPECTLLGMLQGTVTHWDDPALVAANPGLTLPHQPITVVARTTRSGTTEVFTTGLANIDAVCNAVPTMNVTSTWALKTDIGTTSSSRVLELVASTAWSIGYASAASAREAGATEAIVQQSSGHRVSTDAGFVEGAMSAATFDGATGTFRFVYAPKAYPFVGASYYLYHTSYPGNCTYVKHALDFVKWSIGDSSARSAALEVHYVPVIKTIVDAFVAEVGMVQCGGQFLYPQPPSAAGFPIWIVVVAVAVVALAVLGSVFVVIKRLGAGARDVRNAPTEAPLAIVFTAIDEATKLWTNCPASMSVAVADHHRVVRAAIAKFGAYEVKTIGESFMIATHTAEDAVRLAVAIQENLHTTMCPASINEVYETGDCFVIVDDDPEDLAAIEPTWNGLRVKIGIHMGSPEVRFDEVTKGYDYYGNDVNVAARVASTARGGEVLCTSTTADALTTSHKLHAMGAAELKGVVGKTSLTGVGVPSLPGRVFAPLREEDMEMGGDFAATTSVSNVTESNYSEHIETFAFVRDGTMSYHEAEGEVLAMAENMESLFVTSSASDRVGVLKMLRHAWHLPSGGDLSEDYMRLAMKVFPLTIASSHGRRQSRHSIYQMGLSQTSVGFARFASSVSSIVAE